MIRRCMVPILLLLAACSTPPPPTTICLEGIAMTMPYRILVAQDANQRERARISSLVSAVFALVNAHFNNWNPRSEISQINALPAGIPHHLSPELSALLNITAEVVTLTEGRFDPTIAPICRLWIEALRRQTKPPLEEIDQLRKYVGWNTLLLTEHTITKTQTETKIDLSGIAKGHGVDLLVQALTTAGYENVYVAWGGEIRASGCHPSDRPWNAAIASPNGGTPLSAVVLTNQAVATSGSYEQIWMTDEGLGYSHLCDPHTGLALPLAPNTMVGATVLAPTCAVADGVATAMMIAENRIEAETLITQWESLLPDVSILVALSGSI